MAKRSFWAISFFAALFFPIAAAAGVIAQGDPDFSVSERFCSPVGGGTCPYPSYFLVQNQYLQPSISGNVRSIQLYARSNTTRKNIIYFVECRNFPTCSNITFNQLTGTTTQQEGLVTFFPVATSTIVMNPSYRYYINVGNYEKDLFIYGAATSTIHNTTYFYNWLNAQEQPTSVSGMWSIYYRVLDTAPAQVPSVDTSLIEPCPILGIDLCTPFGKVIAWAFIPPQNFLDPIVQLGNDIQKKPPFGYFVATKNILESFSTTTGTTTQDIVSGIPSVMFEKIFDPIRSFLVWVIYAFALFAIYNRVKNIVI